MDNPNSLDRALNLFVANTSPRGREGRTHIVMESLLRGLTDGAAERAGQIKSGSQLYLSDYTINACRSCNGWGPCSTGGVCPEVDDFPSLFDSLLSSDGVIIGSPIYFGDMTELANNFLNRVRRHLWKSDRLANRPFVMVTVGDSGRGSGSALAQAELYLCFYMKMKGFAYLPVCTASWSLGLAAAYTAGKEFAKHILASRPGRVD